VLTTNAAGSAQQWRQITNDTIAPGANIDVSKLAAGAEGRTIVVSGGVVTWALLPSASITPGTNAQVMVTDTGASTWSLLKNANWSSSTADRLDGNKVTPDFGAQNIITTGQFRMGATLPTLGDMRVKNLWSWYGATNGGLNARLANWDASDVLTLGDPNNVSVLALDASAGGGIHLDSGGVTRMGINSSFAQFSIPLIRFTNTVTGNPVFTIQSGNAQKNLIVRAQTNSDANGNGPAILLQGGGGNGTGLRGGGRCQLNQNDTTFTTVLEWSDVGGASALGFYAATPIVKPAVAGSRANPEQALANLLTALANLGLITNSTTA
jgi:hypothetical protein